MSRARLVSLLSLLLWLLALVPLGFAQTSETGLPPYGALHGGGIDAVSLENGNLHIEIPIYSVHQRALPNETFNFVYDIAGYQMDESEVTPTTFQWTVSPAPHQRPGWHLLANQVGIWHVDHDVVAKSCTYLVQGVTHTNNYNVHTNYALTDTHGTTHPFEVRHVDQPAQGCTDPVGNQNTGVALDGTGYTIAIGANAYSTTISMPNDYGPLNGNSFATPGVSETDQNDANGHLITTTWTYTDSNGTQQQLRVDYGTVTLQTHLCSLIPNLGSSPCVEYSSSSQLPQKLTLPTGKFYLFTWSTDGNADLLRMDLPTGGYIAYTYRTYTKFLGNTFAPSGNGRGHGPALGHYRGRRQITSRAVSDGITANTWSYSIGTGGTVTDPLGNDEVHAFTAMGDPPTPPSVETQILYYKGSASSGTLLKTINKDYASEVSTPQADAIDHGDINLRLIRETTILDNGQQTKTETDYETFSQAADPTIAVPVVTRLNPIEKREYAYGAGAPGALIRRTDYTYLHTGNQNYLSRNIVRQVATTTVYDGNSIQVAQTVNEYDNYAHPGQPMVASNAIQHDPTYTTSFTFRGNVTAVSRWRNTDGASLTTTNQYDDAGNPLSTIDPLGHKTSYDYTDSWSNTTCLPSGPAKIFATTITNALNQANTNTFNSCTGTLASAKDANNLTVAHSYEMMHRRIQSNLPDAGQATACFSEVSGSTCYSASLPLSITQTQKINSTLTKSSKTILDGLGRATQAQLTSDPQGAVLTDTAYDQLGRVATVSNPYRQGTDPTSSPGTTTYGYDALGRKTSEIYPDGSVLTTAYCGASTLVTDPTGRWRRSITDALGRLIEVDEPNAVGATVTSNGCVGTGEPIFVTSYSYDTLGNLTNVLQNGSHQRTFTYNSLSQMLTSTNPEVGTITYTYDSDGNVATKKDARNITVTYGYDVLHRLLTTTYSNGDPTITTTYDQAACLGLTACQNIGHATSITDGAGSESWAYQTDPTNFRSVHVNQRTTTSSPSNITKTSSYVFDLAANLTSITYPTGRIVNYTYDAANRPQTAVDSANGITYAAAQVTPPTGCLTTGVCYTPQGTEYSAAIGKTSTFNGVNLSETYNSRLQPLEIKASSSAGNAFDITYSFVDPTSGGNSGHVNSITNNLDGTRSQSFTHDQLNRITGALTTSTYATSPTHCWGETYGLDAWGNLNSIAATTNSNYTGCTEESGFSTTADGNNHFPIFGYDVSGNAQSDGLNAYTYDAESQIKTAAGVTYLYDGSGRRVSKSSGKLYWYGSGGEILAETTAAGATLNEYIFFAGKRVALLPAGGNAEYYAEDFLGSSRVTTTNNGTVCYDADFYPYGGERAYTNSCPSANVYKFEGKERDTETGNDDFGARYYSNRFGRWLSADWSSTPVAVPYANLTNPQTLNLYAMVSDDPESFADLDGHCCDWSSAWDAVKDETSFLGQEVVGAGKTLVNIVPATYNVVATVLNAESEGSSLGYTNLPLAPTLPLNSLGQAVGGDIATLGVVATGLIRNGPAPVSGASGTGESVGSTIPKEGIYEGPDATAPGKTYVGQSGNIPERLSQHGESGTGKFPEGTKVSTTEVTGGKTAREIAEQKRIDQLGGVKSKPGSQTSNIRNPIGSKRKDKVNNP
jgi:RHS repeat-associated protein